jgi:transcription-repair coupling factor (superfamily II helicase)
LETLRAQLRDRFGPLPPALQLLLEVGKLKLLGRQRDIVVIETKGDKLMLTRAGDYITPGGKFPRLTKKEPKARLREIKRLIDALE